MVSKWCFIKDIRNEGGIVALSRDIYMLTSDEVEDGSYVHVCKPRRVIRGAWAKFDLISVKLTKKTLSFSLNFVVFEKKP